MGKITRKKRDESRKRILDAFQLATKRSGKDLRLSDIVEGCHNPAFEEETVFGFNVRLKNDDAITPLLGGGVWKSFKSNHQDFGRMIAPNLTIPRLFKESNSRIIKFALSKAGDVENIEGLSPSDIEKIKNAYSFASIQKMFLFPDADKVYFWISRECGNLTKGGARYLSNILIISPKEEHIRFVEDNHIDFVRFLFQMEMAYAAIVEKERKVESIKSAVAAMMSRNMSHNLGSHYLFYTKMYLESLANSCREKGPDIRGAARVLGYMQARMDYLATIVSNYKYPYGSVNFKSQILDELTIDDFSKRHYGTNQDAEFKKRLDMSVLFLDSAKQKVDEIATLFGECKSLDGNAFTQKRKVILDELSQLRLTVGDIDSSSIYSRTTNYLLTYLIKSENYARPNVLDFSATESFNNLYLYVRLWNDENKQFELFTGSNEPGKMAKEGPIKDQLSRINLALPGGTMSCHAFYSILENFIRNSAKYSWTGKRPDDLKITIALKVDEGQHTVECTIYDNKHDALISNNGFSKGPLLNYMVNRLSRTRVLTENHTVDTENKGLKEMLFSALWLSANRYEERFAEIISSLEDLRPNERIDQIAKYAFRFVGVNDDGLEDSRDPSSTNLGIRLVLPLFTRVESLQSKSINDFLKLHTDVVEVPDPTIIPSKKINRPYSQIFTRVYSENMPVSYNKQDNFSLFEIHGPLNEYEDVLKLKQAISSNLGDIDQYTLRFASVTEPWGSMDATKDSLIVFDTHLSTRTSKSRLREYLGKYAYIDTISGGNFTKTLQGLFLSGLSKNNKSFKTYSDYYLSLKIKESGLTRITIIDERLFNSIEWGATEAAMNDPEIKDDCQLDIRSSEVELSMKNIRVLNYLTRKEVNKKNKSNKCVFKVEGLPFYGNEFFQTGPCKNSPNATHFLSIHLGVIEKLLKSTSKSLIKLFGDIEGNPLDERRINKLMSLLESTFDPGTKNGAHICIHSGRGDYSKELEGPLRNYPFISLASLENAFNNSKYLLSQLFYNTIYIGKGEVNR